MFQVIIRSPLQSFQQSPGKLNRLEQILMSKWSQINLHIQVQSKGIDEALTVDVFCMTTDREKHREML